MNSSNLKRTPSTQMHTYTYVYYSVFHTPIGYHTITINLHFTEYLTSIPVMALMKAQFKLLID